MYPVDPGGKKETGRSRGKGTPLLSLGQRLLSRGQRPRRAVRNLDAQVQAGRAMPRLGIIEGLVVRPIQALHSTRNERSSVQSPRLLERRDSSWDWQRNMRKEQRWNG